MFIICHVFFELHFTFHSFQSLKFQLNQEEKPQEVTSSSLSDNSKGQEVCMLSETLVIRDTSKVNIQLMMMLIIQVLCCLAVNQNEQIGSEAILFLSNLFFLRNLQNQPTSYTMIRLFS